MHILESEYFRETQNKLQLALKASDKLRDEVISLPLLNNERSLVIGHRYLCILLEIRFHLRDNVNILENESGKPQPSKTNNDLVAEMESVLFLAQRGNYRRMKAFLMTQGRYLAKSSLLGEDDKLFGCRLVEMGELMPSTGAPLRMTNPVWFAEMSAEYLQAQAS